MHLRSLTTFAGLLLTTTALAVPPGGLPAQANPRARDAAEGAPSVVVEDVRLDDGKAGAYAFAVVIGLNTTKEDAPPPLSALYVAGPTLTVEGRRLAADGGAWARAVDTDVRVGTGRGLRAELTLLDARGSRVWTGTAAFPDGELAGAWAGTWTAGDAPGGFGVEAARLHPTGTRGVMELTFSLLGEASLLVAEGDLRIYDGSSRVPVYEATLAGEDLHTTRTFTAAAAFDGDPSGSTYEVSATFTDTDGVVGTANGTIGVIRTPGNAVAPGPILGVFQGGYGNGYNPPSAQGQTQQAQLL